MDTNALDVLRIDFWHVESVSVLICSKTVQTIIAGYRLAMRESIKYIQEPADFAWLEKAQIERMVLSDGFFSKENLSLKVDTLEQVTGLSLTQ